MSRVCQPRLCSFVLCYSMLNNAMQCYAIVCNAIQCYAMLCNTMQCYAMRCYVSQFRVLHVWPCFGCIMNTLQEPAARRLLPVSLSSSISPHPIFSSSPPAALHPSAENRYLFRNLSVEIILHLGRSLSTHNYHGQSCRTVLNSAGSLMTLLTARPLRWVACTTPALNPPPISLSLFRSLHQSLFLPRSQLDMD